MELIQNHDNINEFIALFCNKTVSLELMGGVIPTLAEAEVMTPLDRTSDVLHSIDVVLSNSGRLNARTEFTPVLSGICTWVRLISDDSMITTDEITADTSAVIAQFMSLDIVVGELNALEKCAFIILEQGVSNGTV